MQAPQCKRCPRDLKQLSRAKIACRYKNGQAGAVVRGFHSTTFDHVILADNLRAGAQVVPTQVEDNSEGISTAVHLIKAVIVAPSASARGADADTIGW